MIERAIRLQEEVDAFCGSQNNPDPIPSQDILSRDDWRQLVEIMTILRPIWNMTLRTQGYGQDGSHGRLWEVITAMEYLLSHFEGWKAFYNDPSHDAEVEASQASSQASAQASSQPASQSQSTGRTRRNRQTNPPSTPRPQETRYNEAALPFHARQEYISTVSGFSEMGTDSRQLMRVAINNGWKKLDEYYSLTGESALYAAALLLHPAFNLKYLERNWRSDRQVIWVSAAKVALAEYFNRWYPSERPDVRTAIQCRRRPYEPDSFEEWVEAEATMVDEEEDEESDELQQYLQLPRQQGCNPIQWWFEHQGQFPRLSQMALDILAIPSQSANCERAFSAAKLTLTSQRQSMEPSQLEKIQCLRQWLKGGAVTLGDSCE